MRPFAIHTYENFLKVFHIFYLADYSKVSTFFPRDIRYREIMTYVHIHIDFLRCYFYCLPFFSSLLRPYTCSQLVNVLWCQYCFSNLIVIIFEVCLVINHKPGNVNDTSNIFYQQKILCYPDNSKSDKIKFLFDMQNLMML